MRPLKEGSCTPRDLTKITRPNPRDLAPKDLAAYVEAEKKYCGSETGSSTFASNGMNLIRDWHGLSMPEFAGQRLVSYVDRPVIDKTGLTGRFDFHLEFFRENSPSGMIILNGVAKPAPSADAAESSLPSIFNALKEQLGLKLSPANGSLEVIVIDRVERPSPS